jgi:hypothetical protein
MNEIWRPVKNFEPYYLISDLGRVKTIKTELIRKLQIHEDGYLYLLLCINEVRYKKYIHKLVAEAFIDNPLNLVEVNHIDGNKQNNSISNLEWCTHINNMVHANKNNLIVRLNGENISSSKLTEQQVFEIRNLKGKLRGNVIAKRYNVCKDTIYDILHGRTWKHLL